MVATNVSFLAVALKTTSRKGGQLGHLRPRVHSLAGSLPKRIGGSVPVPKSVLLWTVFCIDLWESLKDNVCVEIIILLFCTFTVYHNIGR